MAGAIVPHIASDEAHRDTMTDSTRTNRVAVLMSDDEAAMVREEAERQGISMSEYFRTLAISDVRGRQMMEDWERQITENAQ